MDRTRKTSSPRKTTEARKSSEVTTPTKDGATRKPSTPSKADATRKQSASSRLDSTRKASTPSKDDSTRKASTPSRVDSARKTSTPGSVDSTRKPSTPGRGNSAGKATTPSRFGSDRKPSTPGRDNLARKPSTPNRDDPARKPSTATRKPSTTSRTTPARKPSRKESAYQMEDDIEEDGWTEAYLRAKMAETESSKELDLSHKSLDEIPPDVFNIKEAEILDVSDNPLGSIPVNVASLSNLKELRAAGCDIAEVSGNVSRCTYLTKIDFSRNPNIPALPSTMKQLQYLKYFAVSGCELKSLLQNLTLLAKLETLDLSKNELTTLPSDISGLKRVKVLILNDNAFRSIPESIMSLGRLDCLEMKRNKLNNSRGDLELNVPQKIKILDMEENYSLGLLPQGLGNLEDIKSLNFSYCGIETLPDSIEQLSTLERIHLAGNKLRTLPESFGRLVNLETLDLEGNRRLSSLPLSLHHLRKLKEKETGTNTGLILDNAPALDLPERKIVREGVVSILTELLAEDSLNSVTANIAAEVVDDTIIDSLSDDIVTIVEGGLCDDLMLYITDVAIIEEGCVEDYFTSVYEDVVLSLVKEVAKEVVGENQARSTAVVSILDELIDEIVASMKKEVATRAVQADVIAWEVMEELLQEVKKETGKSVLIEEEEEWRLGQTVPEEYDKQFSYEISATTSTVQSVDLPAGCNLSIPPGATDEDTSVISAVLNPHGYDGTLELEEDELLVSDIIEMKPAGMTFSKPVKLKIPHSLPKFDREREYIVMTSENDGMSWMALKTLRQEEQTQRFVIVEVAHFSSFAVVAKPLEHCHRVKKGRRATLTSSNQTGIEVHLPKDCIPREEEISFKVFPVDKDTLTCTRTKDNRMGHLDSMSHIVKFFKGSNLLLNSPATIVLPLSPGDGNSQVRILSCNENGHWEDVTSKVDDIVLQESKVAFKTERLSSGFTVLRDDKAINPNVIVPMVAKNTRARQVRTVIFKKWKEPREEGIMSARMECLLEEMVEDRICRAETKEGYERQEGTPTFPMVMMENETFCAIFEGSIRPDVEEINTFYGVDFTFFCERTRVVEFDVKIVDKSKDASSTVQFYPGRREIYHPTAPGEEGATPLATAEISAPTGTVCDYWLTCQRFKKTLGIEGTYFSPDHDKCYCETCLDDRGDQESYMRGNPQTKYARPVDWSRFGLSINPAFKDKKLKVFTDWHRSYHGTRADLVNQILQTSSQLLMPGDVAIGGHHLGKGKGSGFDSVQIFTSPSIKYSGLDIYAEHTWFRDSYDGKVYRARVAFQVCVRPGSYNIMGETVGATGRRETIDPLFKNSELEWFTKERGVHALYGLLVKLEAH